MPRRLLLPVPAVALAAFGLLAVPLFAQFGEAAGSLHCRVVDEQGGVLPEVSVALKGPEAPQLALTDSRGELHFINLAPGKYSLTLARAGLATINRENVVINLGRDTAVTVTMKLSSVAATVTVSGEVPVIDSRKVETGATVTQDELRQIPTARDPWVILQTIPGVLVDRVNVAGSESGDQSFVSSKGSTAGTFQVDGVNLTDMQLLGASQVYYDFDSFQEMQVITGGSDPAVQGSGAHLNMITKRGTNDVHGSARIYVVDDHFESGNLPPEAMTQPVPLSSGNHIQSLEDYGAEVGGPVWKDRIWLWGAYGRDQINLVAAGGGQDKKTLEDFNAKLNWQVAPSNTAEVWYLRSDKLRFGRNAGPTRPQPTTWDQVLPHNTWKIQDSQVISSKLFASAQYSGANGDFQLRPEGGLAPQSFLDGEGVWHNTYFFYEARQPQRQVKADASYFFNTGGLGHELKAGFTYLKSVETSTSIWPGDGSNGLAKQTFGDLFDCSVPCAAIVRDSRFGVETRYWGGFAGDTITIHRLTVNLGLRWDEQYGINYPSSIPANGTFPQILPAFNYPGRGRDFTWKNWQPRFGVTYALGANRNTILKASYAQYAETLGNYVVAIPNNSAFGAAVFYAWNDANHNNLVEPGEVDTSPVGFQFSFNYNPQAPGNPGLPTNLVDPGLQAPRTREIIGGVEHEFSPGFAVGVNYTYRTFRDQLFGNPFDPNTGHRLNYLDYEQYATLTGVTPNGVRYEQPVYRIKESVLNSLGLCTPDGSGGLYCQAPAGSYFLNRPDFYETYNGVELALTKRLSNRWMARGSFTYNANTQHLEGPAACVDPTGCLNNGLAARQSLGSGNKGAVFLNSTWQFSVTGLYQLPLGFAIAANLFGRQGYPISWYRQAPPSGTDGLTRNVVVDPTGASRYKDVFELDLRAQKVVNVTPTFTLALSVDCFNVSNQNTVLQRQNRLDLASTNTVREIQSPRVWRFGARIRF